MRPMMARSRISKLSLLAAAALLAGCAGEVSAPKTASPALLQRSAPLAPRSAQRALLDAVDGTYTFTIDPSQPQTLQLGASYLDVPANSVCELATSSYGSDHWNEDCTPETAPVTITAIIRNAATLHPSVEFQPAMRFNPANNVMLYLYLTDPASALAANNSVKYCNSAGCVDESVADSTLQSYIDVPNNVVFRRIKHFSGYIIAGESGDTEVPDALLY